MLCALCSLLCILCLAVGCGSAWHGRIVHLEDGKVVIQPEGDGKIESGRKILIYRQKTIIHPVTSEVLEAYPQEGGWMLAIEAVWGVGRYQVRQQPDAANGWEAIVRVDDTWTGDDATELVLWAVPEEP